MINQQGGLFILTCSASQNWCKETLAMLLTYFKSREIIESWVAKNQGIHLASFSDSYILYADDDTAKSFWRLEQAARWIMNEHLQKKLPLQGALSCGQFHADSADNI